MSAILAALYKITVLGLVCGGLLTLGGSGGQKEILRLGCACVMAVVLLSVVQKTELPVPDLSRYEGTVQQQVEGAQEEIRKATLRQTETELAAQLEQQASNLQLECKFTVICTVGGNNKVTVQQVEGIYHSGPRENLGLLRENIKTQLAVGEGQIVIREATP